MVDLKKKLKFAHFKEEMEDKKDKSNNRPISTLSSTSKICQRCLYNQLYNYFYKEFSTQLTLPVMTRKIKTTSDSRDV